MAPIRRWMVVAAVVLPMLTGGCRVALPSRPDPDTMRPINSMPPALTSEATLPPDPPMDADQAVIVEKHCTVCHDLDRVTRARLDWGEWRAEVGHMVQNGAVLTVRDQQTIVDYLAWRW
jgi:hypothetical protein